MHRHPPRPLALAALSVAAATVALSSGCLDREAASADPNTQSQIVETVNQGGALKLDLLFVVDNSNSMNTEQLELGARVEDMIRELVAPTPSPDGETPPPLEDLHVAVVTTDMGSGGYPVGTCDDSLVGDNGVVQHSGADEGCAELYDPFLTYDGQGEPGALARDFACVAHLGTGGCGLEQPLEASLAALETQAAPGRPNAGFLRDDSVLGVIFVTDEDDCSAADPALYDTSREDLGSARELNLRCTRHPEMLHPVERYVEALRRIRPDPNRLVVAAIVGVPEGWDGRLQTLRDLVIEDFTYNGLLRPSCVTNPENPRAEYATSPVRIAELVSAFGNSGVIHSICADDWRPALIAITRKLQERLTGQCLSRRLPLPAAPDVCRVVETRLDADPCPGLAPSASEDRSVGWQVDLGVEEGRRSCQILPADYDADGEPDGALEGWYYVRNEGEGSEDPECPGEVRFTDAAVPSPGAHVRIECLTALCPARRQCAMPFGMPCDLEAAASCGPDETCVPGPEGGVCVARVRTSCGGGPSQWLDDPVISNGCCHTGYHCEVDGAGAPACVPNRTTACR